MKRLLTFITLIYCTMMAMAQYQVVKEQKAEGNRPLAEFAQQQKVLWNFDWEFFQTGGARGFKPMCEGWYRKTFVPDETWKGLNVKRFDPTRKTTVAMFPARAGAIGQREKPIRTYLCTQDEAYLRQTAYPLMKGAADFCLAWLIPNPYNSEELIAAPCTSPENEYVTGLRARGGFEVSIRWQDGKVVEAPIKNCSPKASDVTVKYNGQQKTIQLKQGESKKI